ncbi:hypothetical protein ACFFNY_00005 [Paenibacillus hodogayensis]|uniref:GNAT family N-acetyltransferase n=1 Tax=Paenibacillus hodogayensis TaxID=279208 RepID=A0ABV5VNU0_9BACL
MTYLFRSCELEMDYEAYVRFLLQHHDELNLPYSFSLKMSFFSSPLFLGRALLVYTEEPYEIVGAAGFVYGTGANDYEDRHICQVEIAFLRKGYRRTSLFLRGLQTLLALAKEGNPEVERIQFWLAADQQGLKRLLTKFAALPGSTSSVVNNLTLHSVSIRELEAYCRRFKPV